MGGGGGGRKFSDSFFPEFTLLLFNGLFGPGRWEGRAGQIGCWRRGQEVKARDAGALPLFWIWQQQQQSRCAEERWGTPGAA